MRLAPLQLLLLAPCLSLSAQDVGGPWDLDELQRDLRALAALHPRLEASDGELAALEFVRSRLASLGVPQREISFAASATTHSFSRGIEALLDGSGDNSLLIVVAMDHPVDAPPDRDGSVAIAVGLQLARALHQSGLPLNVRLLFLGAQHGAGQEYPLGTRRFLEDFYPPAGVVVVCLDIAAVPERLSLHTGANGIVSPFWLIRRATLSLDRSGVFFRVRGNENQIFRIGAASERSAIEPFLRAGYPALSLEGEFGAAGTDPLAWLRSFQAFVSGFLQEFGSGLPAEWDRHYLLFQARDVYLTIPERLYVLLFCGAMALAIAYSVLRTSRLTRYARALLRSAWFLPLSGAVLFAVLYVATLLISYTLSGLDFPDLWQLFPLEFLLLKALMALLAYLLISPLLRRLPVPRRGGFYAASSVLLLVCAIVAVALYEFSLTYYFVWALLFVVLSVLSRRRTLKLLFLLPAPYWLLKACLEFFSIREMTFIRWVLLEPVWGNLMVAGAVAPFVLLLLRLGLLLRFGSSARRRTIRTAVALTTALSAVGLVIAVSVRQPYRGELRQPLAARAVYDEQAKTSLLYLESPTSIGEVALITSSVTTRLETRSRQLVAAIPEAPPPFAVSSSSTAFLGRRNESVSFTPGPFPLRPYRLRLELHGEREFVLYDANFPYTRDPGGLDYSIRIGVNPPFPLTVELTLPEGMAFDLEIRAEYLSFPPTLALLARGSDVERRMESRAVYPFET